MDPNPFVNPPIGFILFGLVLVLLLAAAVYALGAWGAARMRQGRIDDGTTIPYPDQPQSADDRETVRRAQDQGHTPDRIMSDEQLRELELGDRKLAPQTPTRGERPVDAADRDKNRHQIGVGPTGAATPASEQGQGQPPDDEAHKDPL